MQKVRNILAYTWALLTILLLLVTFIGNNFFAEVLVQATGIKVSPWETGGEVKDTIDYGDYLTEVHRPVFDGLFGERDRGFVQIIWKATRGELPERIVEEVDYDQDGTKDFVIDLNTKTNKAILNPYHDRVMKVEQVYKLEMARAIRVALKSKCEG